MKARAIVATFVVVILSPLLSHVVLAHHSTAYYALEPIVVRGTVFEFRWRNPHAVVLWDVKDEKGKVVRWSGELSSVTTLMGDGLTKNSVKPGDEIVFMVRPSKTGAPASTILSMKKPDGTVVMEWSTQSETGLNQEQARRLRVLAGLPPDGPGQSGRVTKESSEAKD
jgi:hypothetical protein